MTDFLLSLVNKYSAVYLTRSDENMKSEAASLQILKSLSDATSEVVSKVSPSVVSVMSKMGRGSGVILSSDGYMVTCSHVVGRQGVVKVGLGEDKSFEAKVVGQDPYSDVALLKIDGGSFKPIELGDSEKPKIGEFVLALANPFNYEPTATLGIVTNVRSSLRRLRGMAMEDAIVTDARLNPGYSGGPLVDVSGRMIGFNMAYVWSRGIAVPINNVKNIVDRLTHGENIKRAYLGITSNTIPLPSDIAAKVQIRQDAGVLVFSVEADSPAKKASLEFGDIIVKFNDKSVTNVDDLPRMLTEEVIEKATKLGVLRGGRLRELTIVPIAAGVEVNE